MAGGDLGEGTRLAAATGAYVCFEDEAGQNLRPPKARTWAPRGRTPVVRVSGKGSGRVSVAGLVCLRPGARARLFYRTRVHHGRKGERRSMSEADYAVADHRRAPGTEGPGHPCLGPAEHPRQRRDAGVRQLSPGLADRGAAARLRARAECGRGGLGGHEGQPGQPRRPRRGPTRPVTKNRLKRIQYRPALIEAFLARTGLTLEPQPP